MNITMNRAFQKSLLLVALGSVSLVACAQQPAGTDPVKTSAVSTVNATPSLNPAKGTPDARALEAIHRMNPNINPESIKAAPMAGFREVIAGGQVVYVSDDGKYIFLAGQGGGLYDSTSKTDLSDRAMSALRGKLLATIPKADRIVFAPADPKYTVTVFTDIECGYCRKLHSEIAEINKQGIAVEYVAFPRQGLGSQDYKNMISVWCAADRKNALTTAKTTGKVVDKDCKNTVAAQYAIGQRAGLTGTPMILASDGTYLAGYLPPATLKARLDEWAKTAK